LRGNLAIEDDGEELVEWASRYERDWERAWQECPRGDWLVRLASDLPVDPRRLVGAVVDGIRACRPTVDPDEDPGLTRCLDVATATLDEWSLGQATPERCYEQVMVLMELRDNAVDGRALQLIEATRYATEGLANSHGPVHASQVLGAILAESARNASEFDPFAQIARRRLTAVEIARALERQAKLRTTPAGRWLGAIPRQRRRGEFWARLFLPLMRRVRPEIAAFEAVVDVLRPHLDPWFREFEPAFVRWAMSFDERTRDLWNACPRGDWLCALLEPLDVDRAALVLAAADCVSAALDGFPAERDRIEPHLEAARAWTRGATPVAECQERTGVLLSDAADLGGRLAPGVAALRSAASSVLAAVSTGADAAGISAREAAAAMEHTQPVWFRAQASAWRCAQTIRGRIPFEVVEAAVVRATRRFFW
jgi:hypothetical protein